MNFFIGFSRFIERYPCCLSIVCRKRYLRDPRGLTSEYDYGPFALYQVSSLCRDYGLSVSTDVQAVRVVFENALEPLGSRHHSLAVVA